MVYGYIPPQDILSFIARPTKCFHLHAKAAFDLATRRQVPYSCVYPDHTMHGARLSGHDTSGKNNFNADLPLNLTLHLQTVMEFKWTTLLTLKRSSLP